MSIAAVPKYLGRHFETASPGMRFGLYLPIWTERADQEQQVRASAQRNSREAGELERILDQQGMDAAIAHMRERRHFPVPWEKNDAAARSVWQQVARLSPQDQERTQALLRRQSALAAQHGGDGFLTLEARAIAPFTTGLGNEHPLENGFAFLWPHGIPYLPGSGVKGVIRQAARELAGTNRGDRWEIESDWDAEAITALFGHEDSDSPQRGVLSFWDVIPDIEGDRLLLEIMTPHQTHYYQQGGSPHESGQPNPIPFLTVPPGSAFRFHVVCNRPLLRRLAPELAKDQRWRILLQEAFLHAFEWLGFGAKTAVGYGAMEVDESSPRDQDAENQEETLGPEQNRLRELRKAFAKEQAEGPVPANGKTAALRMEILREAGNWEDPALRIEAAQIIRQTLKALPWSKKAKKQGINERLSKLEQTK